MFKLGKVKLPHRKQTADIKDVKIPIPSTIVLPMSQYAGASSIPTVKVGDKVSVGTKVASGDGRLSGPIHSSVSGTVKKIADFLPANGNSCQAITIESDGEMTLDESIAPPQVENAQQLCDAIRESGLIGLGGAGFPTANKLENAINKKVETVIINGAECEPYITVDNRTMIDSVDYLVKGVDILKKFIPSVKQFIIAIEKNKPQAIGKMTDAFKGDDKVRVASIPAEYPHGEERTLIYTLLGKIVPDGKLPSDIGCVMFNVTSIGFLAHYIETGIPYVWRTVTVDGSAVGSPKNLTAPIGTSLRDILSFADTDFENLGKVLYGGPMMGIAAYDLDAPIYKNTNGIIALTVSDSLPNKQYPCIHCGKCIAHCPMGLNPTAFVKAMKIEDKATRAALLDSESLLSCIECGACSYICPSRRPLVENNRLAKNDLNRFRSEKKD